MLLKKIKVIGHSMEPTIKENDVLLVSSIFYLFQKPSINDIVLFKIKGKILIKRISKIENNKYFLIGDNKKDSFDSDKFGLIEKRDILGKFFFKI